VKLPLLGREWHVPVLAILMWIGCSSHAQAQAQDFGGSPLNGRRLHARLWWIDRPWEIEYFLLVTSEWRIEKQIAERDEPKINLNRQSLSLARAFLPVASIKIADDENTFAEPISVLRIAFDGDGHVTSRHAHERPLRGRITNTMSLVLADGDDEHVSMQYHLGFWFTGIGDASTHWAPGFCFSFQKPDAAQVRSDGYLYGKLYKADEQSTTFGCREWAYQLYDDERPYIDVTSYVPKGKIFQHGTYIQEFIGWARFGDHKPVIGKNRSVWYCLLDCPNGGAPGPIPDIGVWAASNGWPTPKPPTRVPTFPDPPAKAGTYPR
jgi:hypothetical protein